MTNEMIQFFFDEYGLKNQIAVVPQFLNSHFGNRAMN